MAAPSCTASSCAHCGTRSETLRRCARCKEVSYCGADCQKKAWKAHKNSCEEPPTPAQLEHLKDVMQKQQQKDMELRLRDMEVSRAAAAGSSRAAQGDRGGEKNASSRSRRATRCGRAIFGLAGDAQVGGAPGRAAGCGVG